MTVASLCPGPRGEGCDCKANGTDPACPWQPDDQAAAKSPEDQLREIEDKLIDVLASMQRTVRLARYVEVLLAIALVVAFAALIVTVVK